MAECLAEAAARLASVGVETPRLDAEVLLAHVLGVGRAYLHTHPERVLVLSDVGRFRDLLVRRERREPLAYLTGWREFYGLAFRVDRRVLIPRPETEVLVEESRRMFPADFEGRVLDMGTGSGCLAVVLKRLFPRAEVTAVDISEDALAVARENVERLLGAGAVRLVRSAGFAALEGSWDLVVCNPPYVPEGAAVDPEVLYEPAEAVFAGPEGLGFIRPFLEDVVPHLSGAGAVLMEMGGEVAAVLETVVPSGLRLERTVSDLEARPRVAVFFRRSVR